MDFGAKPWKTNEILENHYFPQFFFFFFCFAPLLWWADTGQSASQAASQAASQLARQPADQDTSPASQVAS